MKFLKGLLIVVLILAAVVTVLGMVMPKEYTVERTAVIEACPGAVQSVLTDFQKWESWSPWAERDSSIQSTYEGEPGTVGYKQSWTGDPQLSGKGNMELTAISDTAITYQLNFTEPFESSSNGYFKMKEVDGGVEITWGDHGDMSFPMNVIAGLFMDFDEMIGNDFEKGLSNLQEELKGKTGYEPMFKDSEAINYIGKKFDMNLKDMSSALYAETYAEIGRHMMENGMMMGGAPMAIYHAYDEATQDVTVEIALPVMGEPMGREGLTTGTIPAGRDAYTIHRGNYDETMSIAWENMESYMNCSFEDMRYGPYEAYVTDPGAEPDTSKWETYIVYPLQ